MTEPVQNVTLFVDGSVLKKNMIAAGQVQTPQLLIQYLSHMVQAIRKQTPNAFVTIQYYGARLSDPINLPISGAPYTEPDLKRSLNHHCVPGAFLDNSWGRVSYQYQQPWILKSESFEKTNLTDADFVLNEKPKGVLAQLVCKMAEKALLFPETPLYVYGDMEDMAYALHTSQWLGAKVYQVELHGNNRFVSEVSTAKEPHLCNKEKLQKIAEFLRTQENIGATMQAMRARCPEQNKKSVLMVDMGVIRKHLEQNHYRMSASNIQKVLDQIKEALPAQPTKTVLYFAFSNPTTLISPFPGKAKAFVDSSEAKQILSIPNVEFSSGKAIQDRWYPAVLNKEKWHVPMSQRVYKDFDYNLHQCDVDDRIAYDIALYGMDPSVSQLYLLATDGDFARPVEHVADMGLPTNLIYFDVGKQDISVRLQKGAETTIRVSPNLDALMSRREEDESNRESKKARRNVQRKQLQKMRRALARSEDDYDEPKGTKADRFAEACRIHNRAKRNRVTRRQQIGSCH